MNEQALVVVVDRSGRGRPHVTSPGVGLWSDPPAPGAVVGPGSSLGYLRCLNRRFVLVLPAAIAGVVECPPNSRVRGVSYGEILFHLRPLDDELSATDRAAGRSDEVGGLPQGAHAVCAPTDGVFYRRPGPDAAPFVDLGSRVRQGQPVGLVEVMKTFNQIVYGGPGLPDEAEVIEIRGDDGDEISAGQPLLIVR